MNLFKFFSFSFHAHNERRQADVPLCGRSMVEMLGGLAKIGVLSVGAMSGYSKAMLKYKLNKYTENVNLFINNFIIFRQSLGYTVGERTYYATILQKLNLIPDGWRYKDSKNLSDDFGNNVIPVHDNRADTSFNHDGIVFVFDNSPRSSEICQILVQTAKVNSSFIWMLYLQGSKGYYYTYGDNYCDTPSANCLRNLSVDDIYNLCYTYIGKDASEYRYQIAIVFKSDEYI